VSRLAQEFAAERDLQNGDSDRLKTLKPAWIVFAFQIAETRLFFSTNVLTLPIRLIFFAALRLGRIPSPYRRYCGYFAGKFAHRTVFRFRLLKTRSCSSRTLYSSSANFSIAFFSVRQIVADLISGVVLSFALTDSIASSFHSGLLIFQSDCHGYLFLVLFRNALNLTLISWSELLVVMNDEFPYIS
jgi:hypothetical protein